MLVLSRGRMRLEGRNRSMQYAWATGETFPICGDIIRRLRADYPDLAISPDLTGVLRGITYRQRHALYLAGLEDTPGDPRLLPHQRVACAWLRAVRRGVLADEQGSGKTVSALAGLDPGAQRVLVVCAKTKIHDWTVHAQEWTAHEVTRLSGDFAQREGIIRNWERGVLVAGYDAVILHRSGLTRIDSVIVDEAHKSRNRQTKLFSALQLLLRDIPQVILLTATPTVNSALDIWTLLNLVDPLRWGSYWSFVFRFFHVKHGRFGLRVSRAPREDEEENLQRILSTYVLYRRGLLGLPDLSWERVEHVMGGEQTRLYAQMAATGSVEGANVPEVDVEVAMITRLRQLAIHPALLNPQYVGGSKLDSLAEVIGACRGRALLVFTMFAEAAVLCAEAFGGEAFHGGLSERQRDDLIDRFSRGEVRLLFLTYGTGGEGLNLVRADRVVLLDPPWHPAGIQHAVHRIHRHGQTSTDLRVIEIISVGTVEERIHEIISEKRQVTVSELVEHLASVRGGT